MEFNLNSHIKIILNLYLKKFPEEKERYDILSKQLNNNEKIGSRKNFNWHVTASAYILSPDYEEFVIIHNINLNKWLVPWGHWEEWDWEMHNNSKREAKEETWLNEIELINWHIKNNYIPIDIDTHEIPENLKKLEDKHFHHDFRYIFVLKWDKNIDLQLKEVKWYKWLKITENTKNFSWDNVLGKIREII